jgi:predicted acylesterase/phospholipase RssA
LNQKVSRKFQILSLSGGGYRGLHIAQILEIIEDQIGGRIAKHFDLIAGTSVGGIIGLGLALEIPAKDIRKLLEDVGPKLFSKSVPAFSAFKAISDKNGFWETVAYAVKNKSNIESDFNDTKLSWYDAKPLADVLGTSDFFGHKKIKDLLHPVIIPTVNYSTGLPKFFKTDHHETFTFDRDLSVLDVALGTSAAPIYFPAHKIKDWRIVDGGLVANDPTQVAVHEAMMFFGVRPPLFNDTSVGTDDLSVLAIGTLSPKYFGDMSRPLNLGMLDWGAGVFDLAGSAQEAMSAFMVDKHMLPGKVIRLPSMDARPEKAPGLADVSPTASETLRASAQNLAQFAFGTREFREMFSHVAQTLTEVRSQIMKGQNHA